MYVSESAPWQTCRGQRNQLYEISSLLPPFCGFWGWGLGSKHLSNEQFYRLNSWCRVTSLWNNPRYVLVRGQFTHHSNITCLFTVGELKMKGGLDGIIYPAPVLSLLASNSVCNVCHPHSSIPLISTFKDKMLHRLVSSSWRSLGNHLCSFPVQVYNASTTSTLDSGLACCACNHSGYIVYW